MTIRDEHRGHVTILRIRGTFVGSPCVALFDRTLFPLLKKDVPWIVLDLHQVKILDSAALGAIVAAMVSIKGRGGALKLAGVERELDQIISKMHLDKVFSVYGTVDDAVESCGVKREN